jgi:hypothetical protein
MRDRLAVVCVAEPNTRYYTAVKRLFESAIHCAGISPACLRAVFIDSVDRAQARRISELGACVQVAPRVELHCAHANKLHALKGNEGADVVLAVDCDVAFAADPTPFLSWSSKGIEARPAARDRIGLTAWLAIFERMGVPLPTKRMRTLISREVTIPFFNSGVLAVPTARASGLATSWSGWLKNLASAQTDFLLLRQHQYHWDQIALALAFASENIDVGELPLSLNFPAHPLLTPSLSAVETVDPIILHYHDNVTPSGLIGPVGIRRVDEAITRVNISAAEANFQA